MYRALLTSVVIVALLGCGCFYKPRTVEKYAKDGISFNHYSDWSVVEDEKVDDSPDSRSISVEGPNEAVVMFIFMPPGGEATVEDFAESLATERLNELKKMGAGSIKTEITSTTSEPTTGRVGGRVQNGVLQRFTIKMLGQTIPHEARIFSVANDRMKVFIMAQVNTEDLHDTTPAFDLMLDSVSLSGGK